VRLSVPLHSALIDYPPGSGRIARCHFFLLMQRTVLYLAILLSGLAALKAADKGMFPLMLALAGLSGFLFLLWVSYKKQTHGSEER
jgi:hypothetical protein